MTRHSTLGITLDQARAVIAGTRASGLVAQPD